MSKSNFIFIVGLVIISFSIQITESLANTIGPKPIINTDISKGTLFVSPAGTGTICSKAAPCNIWSAASKAISGDVVFLRGGTYTIYKSLNFNNQGSSTAPIVFESYPGESAVLNGGQNPKGANVVIRVNGNFINLRRIEVKNMPIQGVYVTGSDNVLDGMHVHHSSLTGIQIFYSYEYPYGARASRNIIRNCNVHNNSGAGLYTGEFANGGNSDGISISSGTGNRVENCLVYGNSDDGIDVWRATATYVGYNIVHSNGIAEGDGNGIKAGGIAPSADTTVERNLSYSNKAFGIDYNSSVNATFINNTTWNNSGGSFVLGADTIVTDNISSEANKAGSGIESNNSWQRSNIVAFISTDPNSVNFLVPTINGCFEDIGAYADDMSDPSLPNLSDVIVTQLSYANGIFTSTVKNKGKAATPAGVAVGVDYSVNGSSKTWGDMVGPLAAGASVIIGTRGGAYNIPVGTHTITAYVDDVNRFAEINENNNKCSRQLTLP